MAITILKKGKLPEEKVYEFRCVHCNTEFTAQEKDGMKASDPRDGYSLVVACPVCDKQVFSSREYVPDIGSFPKYPPGVRGGGWQDHGIEPFSLHQRGDCPV